jgi:hypothetical protein
MADEQKRSTGLDGRFFRLVATFEAAAMQQLGKIAHPVTGEVEVNLEGARDSIDMLIMVSEKTDGNLNEDERRLLEHILYQLRLNYVDVADGADEDADAEDGDAGERSEKAGSEAGSGGDGETGGAAEEDAPKESGGGAR